MPGGEERKQEYFNRLIKLLEENPKILIVGADNVGSSQMQKIRQALRGKGTVLMGKNTMIRKAIRGHAQNNPALEAVLPLVRGNVGFVFCTKDTDLSAVKKVINDNKVAAAAKAGVIAPSDVVVPAGNTGMEPTQTSFLQALNIPSRISRGQIEIIQDVPLIKAGNKVGASESNLLAKLNIKPFFYGLNVKTVYDNGAVYDPKFLDVRDEDILAKFQSGVTNVAALSLQIGFPTLASLPHSIVRGYKNLLAIAIGTDYTFKQAEKVKSYLKNPGAFAAAAPAAAPAKGAPAPKKVEAKPVEEEKEEDEEIGGLFGFDD
jgi:large subunit ribosomal protein LP0